MFDRADTIAAVATAPGVGGIGVIRVSGPNTEAIATRLIGGLPEARVAAYRRFVDADGEIIDDGLALYFPAPNSFTGEDVLELQGHGGPVVLDILLAAVLGAGARLARPGEFTERAFLNDKLDLAQAEAVADLIHSGTEAAARAARRSLDGAFSDRVHALVERLIGLRVYVEAAIDFPDEEIDFLADQELARRARALRAEIAEVEATARTGQLLRDGMNVVLAGRPNAGKSSLLNRLSGRESAIVSAQPGTTRDTVRERVQLEGVPLHIIDTAGLRETDDEIEQEGVRRSWRALEAADCVLYLIDHAVGRQPDDDAFIAQLPDGLRRVLVFNKCDLSGHDIDVESGNHSNEQHVYLSVKTGAGLEKLTRQLLGETARHENGAAQFSARRRHLDALARCKGHFEAAQQQLFEFHAGELVAEELRLAQQALDEITGEFSADDLLGEIFSSFCIGK